MTTITLRLMFLPVLFDVGWCYYQHMWWMFYPHIATWEDIIWLMLLPYMSVADVITTEADVIACYILFYYWLMLFYYWLMFLPVLFDVGWCYYQHMWWMFYPHIATWEDIIWLMLLPYMSVADVITTEADVIACYILFYFIIGWCYSQYVADVIATFGVMWWQMLLPGGRCYGHCRVGDGWWLMLLPPGRWWCHGSMIYFNLSSGMLKQNLIPYMWQMVYANISIKGWIVDPYV